jgi:hypothetical protein
MVSSAYRGNLRIAKKMREWAAKIATDQDCEEVQALTKELNQLLDQ